MNRNNSILVTIAFGCLFMLDAAQAEISVTDSTYEKMRANFLEQNDFLETPDEFDFFETTEQKRRQQYSSYYNANNNAQEKCGSSFGANNYCCNDDQKPSISWDCEPVCNPKKNGNLVFTAFDMNKCGQSPDTSFSNVYPGTNFNLRAWSMVPSSSAQQGIALLFGLPNDYKPASPLEITLYLFAQNQSGTGNSANIRIRTDSKGNLQEMGQNFIETDTSGDFPILEPVLATDLESIIVSTCITPTTSIKPGNLMLLVFDRVVTSSAGLEYQKNIYLNGVVVKYPKI